MKSKQLAYGAGAIASILLSFLLFKAMMNLVNCITVPLIFLFFTQGFDMRSKLAVSFAAIVAVVFLFPAQIIFILIDMGMAFLLIWVTRRNIVFLLLYPIVMTILLIMGVVMTDKLFLTQINAFVLRISAGQSLIYLAVFFIESLIISALHFFFYRNILRRAKQKTR
jgi:hypothetical protein